MSPVEFWTNVSTLGVVPTLTHKKRAESFPLWEEYADLEEYPTADLTWRGTARSML